MFDWIQLVALAVIMFLAGILFAVHPVTAPIIRSADQRGRLIDGLRLLTCAIGVAAVVVDWLMFGR